MSVAVKISDELVFKAKIYAKTYHRSTSGQVEYWAKIGQLVEENPDLPYHFIQDILLAMEEIKHNHVEPYLFDERKE